MPFRGDQRALVRITPDEDRRNLVVVRAGSQSLHSGWSGRARNFDLLVCAYKDDVPTDGADLAIYIPGFKVSGLSELFEREPYLLVRYDRIALLDDDIDTDAQTLSRCFDIGAQYGLSIWQPSLSHQSYFSYAVVLQNPSFRLRYVNFVEMMCPFFTSPVLKTTLPLFAERWETGIDTIWCRQFDDPFETCAVVDTVSVTHTRPVGARKEANGFGRDESYDDTVHRFLRQKSATFGGPIAYRGITAGGQVVASRLGVLRRTLRLLGSTYTSPLGVTLAAHLIIAHLKHIATGPLNNSRLF